MTRHPNPHIAFGCGEHSCVGAQLARLEATVMFEELLHRFPRLELVGDACTNWRDPAKLKINFDFPCEIVIAK